MKTLRLSVRILSLKILSEANTEKNIRILTKPGGGLKLYYSLKCPLGIFHNKK